jgi:hypothetical protein
MFRARNKFWLTRVSWQFLFGGQTMRQVIERILRVFGKKENSDSTEEVLLDFPSKKPGTEERSAAVAEVDFLKDLRT